MGARDFAGDNTANNQKIDYGTNASIDAFTTKSFAVWCILDTDSNGGSLIAQKSGNGPGSDGWIFEFDMTGATNALDFLEFWNAGATLARWHGPSGGVSTGVAMHVAFTYDNTSTSNNPVLYLNGAAVAVTNNTAPVGAAVSDAAQNLLQGLNTGLTGDYDGRMVHLAYDNRIWDAAMVNRARWWGRPDGAVKVSHPLVTSKLANEGTATADGTATGASMTGVLDCPVQPRGLGMMLGMGIGW